MTTTITVGSEDRSILVPATGGRMRTYIKAPTEKLDYIFDWSRFLGSDTISAASTVIQGPADSVSPVLADAASGNNTTTHTVWLTGGVVGESWVITSSITTAAGRMAKRSFRLVIQER